MEKIEKTVSEHREIKRLPAKKRTSIEKYSQVELDRIEGLIDAIGATGLDEFLEYIRSPKKMLWPNFVAGVMRGFGALVGATLVIAIIGWFLSSLIDLPLIGKELEPYVQKVQYEVTKYTEATNYKPNFERIEQILLNIKENTSNSTRSRP